MWLQLAEARQQAGLTQQQVANRLKVSQAQAARIKKRCYDAYTLNTLRRYVQALERRSTIRAVGDVSTLGRPRSGRTGALPPCSRVFLPISDSMMQWPGALGEGYTLRVSVQSPAPASERRDAVPA